MKKRNSIVREELMEIASGLPLQDWYVGGRYEVVDHLRRLDQCWKRGGIDRINQYVREVVELESGAIGVREIGGIAVCYD